MAARFRPALQGLGAGRFSPCVKDALPVRDVTMTLPFPPSANRSTRTWRGYHVVNPQDVAFRECVMAVALEHGSPRLQGRIGLEALYHPPTARRWDLDNRIKPLLDALQGCGVFEDDKQVDDIHVIRGEIDREDPRCVVRLRELDGTWDTMSGPGRALILEQLILSDLIQSGLKPWAAREQLEKMVNRYLQETS